ncbi:flagellar motor protein [Owenweeksia hongkongensis DSM 17368]|uniref:Flagellar motor protein n=1 Tax=Owenweeksia hongkongensis (strain DSM 17368 / CIP 108786 / JCM 12287 / NRRL B-23963 / UST20020801) TaxID=926562 RepID=G8R232_OWEHD|nr:OmpA family protein [Owenweeksia hongkongensis]AEV31782.1 flagellar motor protein [Owenweeksia hongkongensis DSM 17368]
MRKIIPLSFVAILLMSSCVSKKKYTTLQDEQKETADKLSAAKLELASCLSDRESAKKEIEHLKSTNYQLLNNVSSLATLSQKGAENLERSLESIKEKDMRINSLNEAISKKDSVTLALVTSLKGVLGNINDEDIEISVEKGVVYVSLSDKLLFKSGSYYVSSRAKEVLGKVAKVVKNKPDMDLMVEGHTDNVSIKNTVLEDNWDLSVKRATSIVRILQDDFGVDPARMTAAGRSYYVPVSSNDSAEGRSLNRRTRIIILPKLDQFYGMIEEGMKEAEAK